MRLMISTMLILIVISSITAAEGLVWPAPPDQPRIAYVDEMPMKSFSLKKGLFDRLGKFLAGGSDKEQLTLPFDIRVTDKNMYIVCQNIPALIEIDRKELSFKYHTCDKLPLIYPIALTVDSRGTVYLSDVENKAIYTFDGDKLRPFITEGLNRPTGLTVIKSTGELVIVDTGEHALKQYDDTGTLLKKITANELGDEALHFPTFAVASDEGFWVNDGLNYRMKRFTASGELIASFGEEGDGPGAFARPKGIALDSDNNLYVIDNLFDNLQIFSPEGRLLLVVGSRGQFPGTFWSPAGIDIHNDTIYVADTFNDRIQRFMYLGDG